MTTNATTGRPRDWHRIGKSIVFLLCLLPLMLLGIDVANNDLGPDPAKRVVDFCGLWALRMLWLCLAMTPLRIVTAKTAWIRYRRMLGLYALFYAALHVFAYVFLLFGAQWAQLLGEISKRPYVIVGAIAFVLLLPLGVTSTRAMQRRLGRRWVTLHRLVYVIALLALLHFTWLKKLGLEATWPYVLILAMLFGVRLFSRWRRN